MDSNFRVNISAQDKATGVIRHVRDEFGRATRPIAQFRNEVAGLAKDTGLSDFVKKMGRVADAASTGNLSAMMSGVGEIAGGVAGAMIPVAGIAIGASIAAAIVDKLHNWAGTGQHEQLAAIGMGVTTQQLEALRGAAEYKSIDPGSVDAAIEGMGKTMYSVRNRLPESGIPLALSRQYGISNIGRDNQWIPENLMSLADAVSSESDPYKQKRLMGFFNQPESMLPLYRLGRSGIQQYAQRYMNQHGLKSDEEIQAASSAAEKETGMMNWVRGRVDAAVGGIGTGLTHLMDNDGIALSVARHLPNYAPAALPMVSPKELMNQINQPLLSSLSDGINISGNAPNPTMEDYAKASEAIAPKVSIELLIKGAPSGTKARATRHDGSDIPVHIEHSMPHETMP